MNKADKALGTSEQRKRMYKSKKMWVIAGISCLTLGGGRSVRLSGYFG